MSSIAAERTTATRVFVSYARRNYYFAECVVRALRSERTEPWWDVQQIKPGDDWDAEIAQALERADALVLIASPAAFASAYVEQEWRAAQRDGKPVHVAYAEAVKLPAELEPASAHDLRGAFDEQAYALGTAIARPAAAGGPIVRHTSGVKAPPIVWTLGALLAAFALISVAEAAVLMGAVIDGGLDRLIGALDSRQALGDASFLLALGVQVVATVGGCVAFTRRRFSRRAVIAWAVVGVVAAFLSKQIDWEVTPTLVPLDDSEFPGIWLPVLVLTTVVYAFVAWKALFSVALARWMPDWDAPLPTPRPGPIDRGAPLPASRTVALEDRGRSRRFAVYSDAPADRAAARELTRILEEHGHVRDEGRPELGIIVISDESRRTWLAERLATLGRRAVCVFVTGVRLPNTLPNLSRHQWVDWRRRRHETPHALARSLGRETIQLTSQPQSIERWRLPTGVAVVFWATVLCAGPAIGAGIGTLLAPRGIGELDALPAFQAAGDPQPLLLGLAPAMLAAGLVLLVAATLLHRRAIPFAAFAAAYGIGAAALLWMGGPPLVEALVVWWEPPGDAKLDFWLSVAILWLAGSSGWEAARDWLPPRSGWSFGGSTLGRAQPSRLWLAYVIASAAFWLLAVQRW